LKIAFVTPLSPQKTGIADFCEEILPLLKNYFDIDLFTKSSNTSNKEISEKFKIYTYDDLEVDEIRAKYDRIVYQIGNNEENHGRIYELALKYKGIVELHDVSIEGLIWGMTLQHEKREKYLDIVEYCHGKNARKQAEGAFSGASIPLWDSPLAFPLNKQIIDAAEAVIVHSDLGFQMVRGIRKDVEVAKIYLHTNDIYDDYAELKREYKKEFGFSSEFVLASFGFGTKTKRILEILEALSYVKKQGHKFKYIIVGKVEKDLNIDKIIKKFELEDFVEVTGYVSLEDLKKYMIATDVCMSLRYPSHGESSAILHRALGMGKFVVLTNEGTFSEYPDDVCAKIEMENEIENIENIILDCIKGKIDIEKHEKNSLEYAKHNFNIKDNSFIYKSFIENPSNALLYDKLDIISDYLFKLGITDMDIIESL